MPISDELNELMKILNETTGLGLLSPAERVETEVIPEEQEVTPEEIPEEVELA